MKKSEVQTLVDSLNDYGIVPQKVDPCAYVDDLDGEFTWRTTA